MNVERITQTCGACPSQWDVLVDGRDLYVRYRWGTFTVADSDSPLLEPFFELAVGDKLDGVMDTDTMLPLLEEALSA